MSQSSTHALSTRLFIQAALTGLLAPTAKGGSAWLVATLAVAAGAVAVGLLLRNAPANAKQMVIGFEGLALVVGGLGLAGGHYIPGTIIGVITLIHAFNMSSASVVPAGADTQWVPPPAGQAPPAYAQPAYAQPAYAQPSYAPPMAATPVTDNPYAPPAPAAPVWAPPSVAPVAFAAAPVEAVTPPQAPAPVEEVVPPPAPAPVDAVRPEDAPPMPRSMTILPGR